MNQGLLLVEDNDQDEKLFMRILRKINLADQVQVVRDGQQALDYLAGVGEYAYRRHAALPTVILLDISLPRINGMEVLRRLRAAERTRLLPIIMLTSSDDQHDRLCCYQQGANSYVCKPTDFASFSQSMTLLASYWMGINRTAHLGT
jgi:CheY-like chemotaxis protein